MFDFLYFILIIWRTCVILYVILIKLIWCGDDEYGQVSNSYKKDYYKKLEKCCKRKSSAWKSQKNYKASVLGLYGQNGSGKTALIDAIALLKFALCGRPIPKQYADFVNVDADAATLEYEFTVKDIDKKLSIM